MPKPKREITPEQRQAYEQILGRIKEVTGATTQVQLAEVLEIRQSSISDSKLRASVPSDWLVKLERSHKVLAVWFESGEGPRYVGGSAHDPIAKVQKRLADITEDFVRLVCRVEQALEIINMTEAQLKQHKAFQAGVLSVDAQRAKDLANELQTMGTDLAAVAQ